jgi:hypothetical protein
MPIPVRIFTFTLFFLLACDNEYIPPGGFDAILIPRTQLENSFGFVREKEILEVGPSVTNDQYVFVVEPYTGIHVYDISQETEIKKIGFIEVIGVQDLAIDGDILYADNAVDLLTIDISNPSSPKIVDRLVNVLNAPRPEGDRYNYYHGRLWEGNLADGSEEYVIIGYR